MPAPLRPGLEAACRRALNAHGRASKWARLGFSTSEDAVTWAVFAYLVREDTVALRRLGRRWLGRPVPAPVVLLWGAPIDPSSAAELLRDALIGELDALGERRATRSEPDVVLDFGDPGLVFVEVKLGAPNDLLPAGECFKLDRYLAGTAAFRDPAAVRASRRYELARNWRIGSDLAAGRPFRLVNLGPADLWTDVDLALERALAATADHAFIREPWPDLLAAFIRPAWLDAWLATRGRLLGRADQLRTGEILIP